MKANIKDSSRDSFDPDTSTLEVNQHKKHWGLKEVSSELEDEKAQGDSESSKDRLPQKSTYKRATKASKLGKSAGRWTDKEHDMFIEGLKLYGRNWKKVEKHIGTRTGTQIRSHAQKFFHKVKNEHGTENPTAFVVNNFCETKVQDSAYEYQKVFNVTKQKCDQCELCKPSKASPYFDPSVRKSEVCCKVSYLAYKNCLVDKKRKRPNEESLKPPTAFKSVLKTEGIPPVLGKVTSKPCIPPKIQKVQKTSIVKPKKVKTLHFGKGSMSELQNAALLQMSRPQNDLFMVPPLNNLTAQTLGLSSMLQMTQNADLLTRLLQPQTITTMQALLSKKDAK
ncbi:unnamed protein product [Moneuplotes crassus]|uniref:Uncharacterized protein n=1 Tax=Euplotes crassus TaxID=5936 RepID=A0AAD1UH03_EUPCR|nr:unnamed protein product [Moneuplotes crassus]